MTGYEADQMNSEFRKEVPVLRREIRLLYEELDRKLHLKAAGLPVEFTLEEGILGAYVPSSTREEEHFCFSMKHISRGLEKPMSKEDRRDLFLHEYAHYMQYYFPIPKAYLYEPGAHGSAFRYCCSLIGAAPTELFKEGDGQKKHDYEAVLEKKKPAPFVAGLDSFRREQAYRTERDTREQFSPGDAVTHPKFGEGTVLEVLPQAASVRLRIRFENGEKLIDQKWLVRSRIRK